MVLHLPTPRPNRPVRSRQHSAKAAPAPDLNALLGLDASGMPDPVTAYELDIEDRCPEVAYAIRTELCAAHATAHLLRLAIEHIDQVMGDGSAYAYPDIVAAFLQSATAIRNQDVALAKPRGRGERR